MEGKEYSTRGAYGAESLRKWHSKHPEGSRLTHGVTSRHFRRKYSDARTVQGRALRDAIDTLVADLGGDLGAGQLLILSRVREKLITLSCIGEWIDRQPSVLTDEGELLPALKNSYLGYSDSLRRDLEWLYSAAARRPSKIPDLESYLRSKTVEVPEGK